MREIRTGVGGSSPDSRVASALRAGTELIGWVGTPWALASHSVVASVASVLLLIGIPTVFTTPGDRPKSLVSVPGIVTVGVVIMELAAAAISVWFIWPVAIAVIVDVLVVAALIAEQPRRRWLLRAPATAADEPES